MIQYESISLYTILTYVHDTMSSSIHDNSTSRSSDTITKIDPSIQKTIDTIRDVAKNMRETSARIRDVVQAIH